LEAMKIRAIITGCTGMVGEGVLFECLNSTLVEKVLVVGRKPCGYSHPKLEEVLHNDFFDIAPIQAKLVGYNACFFCLGVSSVGMKEPEYTRMTYDLTMGFARVLHAASPDLTFCYISGSGTDSTEKGKMMWARVKGKTENDLMKLGFKAAFGVRPGALRPTKGLKNTLPMYGYLGWLMPIVAAIMPNGISTLAQFGQAMIALAGNGYPKNVVEVADIKLLAAGVKNA
jgi:nucleoside-diphosphate-sugar epimerase